MNSRSRSLYAIAHPSVCNVRAPYLAGCNFRQCFFAIWYLGHPLTFTENFTKIVPGIAGKPSPVGVLNARRVAKYRAIFDISKAISRKRCKIAGRLVLVTNRKSYNFMSFRLVSKSVTLNGEMALILHYFTEFGSFRGELRKRSWQRNNYGQFTITMSSSKRLQRDRATPKV